MKHSFVIGLAAVFTVATYAQIIPKQSDHDLRALQAQLTAANPNIAAVCTTDALCNNAAANYCCA